MSGVLSSGTTKRTEAEVRTLIRELVAELAPGGDGEPGSPGARLVDDLGYHSLALLELAFTIEDEFGLEPIDEQTAQTIVTVDDVEAFVVQRLQERAAGQGQGAVS